MIAGGLLCDFPLTVARALPELLSIVFGKTTREAGDLVFVCGVMVTNAWLFDSP